MTKEVSQSSDNYLLTPDQVLFHELVVLKHMLLHSSEIPICNIPTEDFSHPHTQGIARALREMHGAGRPVQLATILGDKKLVAYQADIAKGLCDAPTATSETFIEIIRTLRLHYAQNLARKSIAGNSGSLEKFSPDAIKRVAEQLEEEIEELNEKEIMATLEALDLFCEQQFVKDVSPVIETGSVIDEAAGGLTDGKITVLAGRSGDGKTTLGLHAAIEAAGRGNQVLFVSCEIDANELRDKTLAYITSMPFQMFHKGDGSESFRELAMKRYADNRESVKNLYQICKTQMTTHDIMHAVNKLRAKDVHINVVVVDYIQRMRDLNENVLRPKDARQIINDNLDALDAFARKNGIALLLLAQLNREGVNPDAAVPPSFKEIAGSDYIFHIAQEVLAIKRRDAEQETVFNKENQLSECFLHTMKSRYGQKKPHQLLVDNPTGRALTT